MILVTGVTGFLGAEVARALVRQGVSVLGIGRNKSKLAKIAREGVVTMPCDLSSPKAFFELQARLSKRGKIEAIVHCAALSAPTGALKAFERANVDATKNLVGLAMVFDVPRFIQISSPAVYFDFQDQLNVSEASPLPRPLTHYAATKRASEELVLETLGESAIALRPRGIYGPGDTALLPRLVTAARRGRLPLLRDGRAMTDVTFVTDVVGAVLAALSAPAEACGEVYNISGGEAVNIRQIIDRACDRLGVDFTWKPVPASLAFAGARVMEGAAALTGHRFEPPVSRYSVGILAYSQTLDISKARQKLGWEPRISFDEGIELALEGLQAQ